MTGTQLVDILLLDLPAVLWVAARDRHDALVAALAAHPPRATDSPAARLLAAVDRLAKYRDAVDQPEVELRLAAERRIQQVDVALGVPRETRDDLAVLCATYDEAEAYARKRGLVDSVADADVVKFRHWLLGELVGQIDGALPTPWPG